jgi:hypothetical protein
VILDNELCVKYALRRRIGLPNGCEGAFVHPVEYFLFVVSFQVIGSSQFVKEVDVSESLIRLLPLRSPTPFFF